MNEESSNKVLPVLSQGKDQRSPVCYRDPETLEPTSGFHVVTNKSGTYEGTFFKGVFEGKGLFRYLNGDTYEGEFHRGRRHGQGKYTSQEGEVLEGEWSHGRGPGDGEPSQEKIIYSGEERIILSGGDRYGLAYRKTETGNPISGSHTLPSSLGTYHGTLHNGIFEGRGVFEYKNGDVYEGEFHRGKRHGRGRYTYKSGAVYEGEYREGRRWVAESGTVQGERSRERLSTLKSTSTQEVTSNQIRGFVTFGQAIRLAYSNYLVFEGRATRSEYWFFVLFVYLALLPIGVIARLGEGGATIALVASLFGTLIPYAGVLVRRLRDVGRPVIWGGIEVVSSVAWSILIGLSMSGRGARALDLHPIIVVGVFIFIPVRLLTLYWCALPSKKAVNQ